jgi:hypothetical protein
VSFSLRRYLRRDETSDMLRSGIPTVRLRRDRLRATLDAVMSVLETPGQRDDVQEQHDLGRSTAA